ncbi:hypothetical protein K3U93_13695 [Mycobacterium malmoense]|uniref:LppI n=1 Tax=Mycobacterium malmoense TaxID=1780 RepID=A0ABX3SKC4_MYCMA|nr:hypothetical protein [Mycobacterium malmoense]ORA77142.1 hypothetical protein BST29_23945 [Mycobacterium malmoense]QZA15813.1 hypothetical protein K3U93_13695 [Mycobacterium malmoense]UNB92630.1 hypothetical protein H5T25_13690 [Mycobacterium malmoense]
MRIVALIAASLLVAGCSHTVGGQSGQTQTTTRPSSTTAGPSGGKPPAPSTAPAAGAAISDVIAWIEAGHPADPGRFHTVTRDGVATPLGSDIALTATSGKVSCMTDSKHTGAALACLVELSNPPPRPDTAYGDWQGGWVDFDGTDLQVGASRADPGPFINGNGPELANGDSLSFGDDRCRADQAGLFCVNYAHQSAARFAAAGIQPFGCLRPVPPPDGVGAAFGC